MKCGQMKEPRYTNFVSSYFCENTERIEIVWLLFFYFFVFLSESGKIRSNSSDRDEA